MYKEFGHYVLTRSALSAFFVERQVTHWKYFWFILDPFEYLFSWFVIFSQFSSFIGFRDSLVCLLICLSSAHWIKLSRTTCQLSWCEVYSHVKYRKSLSEFPNKFKMLFIPCWHSSCGVKLCVDSVDVTSYSALTQSTWRETPHQLMLCRMRTILVSKQIWSDESFILAYIGLIYAKTRTNKSHVYVPLNMQAWWTCIQPESIFNEDYHTNSKKWARFIL
jgi:hypothetical protein